MRRANENEGGGVDALRRAWPDAASVTLYMCWHGGRGHGWPQAVMDAAGRLRARHQPQEGRDDDHTALSFPPSVEDRPDVEAVAPYCDLVYVCDADGRVVAEMSGEQDHGSR